MRTDQEMSDLKPSELLDYAVDHCERIERGQQVEADGRVIDVALDMGEWVFVPDDGAVCSACMAGAAFLGAHDYALSLTCVRIMDNRAGNAWVYNWMRLINDLRVGSMLFLSHSHPTARKWSNAWDRLCAREDDPDRFTWAEYREMAEDLRKVGY